MGVDFRTIWRDTNAWSSISEDIRRSDNAPLLDLKVSSKPLHGNYNLYLVSGVWMSAAASRTTILTPIATSPTGR